MKDILIALFISFALSFSVQAAQYPDASHISVTGTAKTQTMPDSIKINLSISKESAELSEAMEFVNKRSKALLDFLRREKIKSEDIDYADLNSREQYRYDQKLQTNVKTGVLVTRNVNLTFRDLKNYNRFLQGLTDTGVTTINPGELFSSKEEQIKQKLTAIAIKKAKTKAVNLVDNLDVKLGKIFTAFEGRDYYRPANEPPVLFKRAEISEQDFSPGKITYNVTYTLVYLIEK